MSDLLTNPIFIIVLIILVVLVVVGIIFNSLNSKRKKIFYILNENREYLEKKHEEYKKAIDNLISLYITDQNIISELQRIKHVIDFEDRDVTKLINANNEIYKLINNPLIKTEEYKDINDSLTNIYNDMYNEALAEERKRYNFEVTEYNTKLADFPSSIIAPFTGHKSLPVFDDSVEKVVSEINNSASYLSNNYKINQETIKSPEATTEEKSNLFLASKNKPVEEPSVVIESQPDSVPTAEVVANVANETPVQDNLENQEETIPENKEEATTLTTAEPVVIEEPKSEEASSQITENEAPSNEEKAEESPVIEESAPIPVVEAPLPEPEVSIEQGPSIENIASPQVEEAVSEIAAPTNEEREIELVNPIANSFEPISINEEESEEVNNNEGPELVSAEPIQINNEPISLNEPEVSSEPIEKVIEEPNEAETTSLEKTQLIPIIEGIVGEEGITTSHSEYNPTQAEEIKVEETGATIEEPTIETSSEAEIVAEPNNQKIVIEKTAEEPTEDIKREEQPLRYCPNCDKSTTEAFCPDCGYPTE